MKCLPEVHEVCVSESDKPCPENSLLAYLYQAVEDSVMLRA